MLRHLPSLCEQLFINEWNTYQHIRFLVYLNATWAFMVAQPGLSSTPFHVSLFILAQCGCLEHQPALGLTSRGYLAEQRTPNVNVDV